MPIAPTVVSGPPPRYPEVGGLGYFTGINNLGDGVGILRNDSSYSYATGFYWHDKGGVELGLWPGYTWVSGVNDDGVVVGTTLYPPDLPAYVRSLRAFRWSRSSGMMLLDPLPHQPIDRYWYDTAWARGSAINKHQMIVGSGSYQTCPEYVYESDPIVCTDWRLKNGPPCPCSPYRAPCSNDNPHGVLYPAGGTIQDMGSLPPQNFTCSQLDYFCGRFNHAVYSNSALLAINSAGHSVGWSTIFTGSGGSCGVGDAIGARYRAWAPGTYGDLNPPAAWSSIAQSINDRDQIVGFALDGDTYEYYMVLWDGGIAKRLRGLSGSPPQGSYGDLYQPNRWNSDAIATGINNNGYIIGNSWGADGFHGVVLKPDGTIVDLGAGAILHALNDKNQVAGAVVYKDWNGTETSHPAIWDLGSEEIVVELSVNPPDVEPVLSQPFNAITQDWEETRWDLTDVKVRVYKPGSPTPVPNATLVLSSAAEDGSGGHWKASHGGVRPNGTFWRAGQDPNAVAGVRDSMTVPVTAIETIYPYLTSGVSGTERLTAAVTVDGKTTTASVDITIQIKGLQPMPRTGPTYVFTDQTGGGSKRHGNINNYLEPAFAHSVQDAFQRYFDKVAVAQRFLSGASKFAITEASLRLGGLLDVSQDDAAAWRNPHMKHRIGTDVDVGYATVAKKAQFTKSCAAAHIQCQIHCNFGNTNLVACPLDNQRHYHLLP